MQAILLDALGTLVELEPPAPHLRRVLHERLGIVVSEEQAASALAAEIAYYRCHLGEGRDEGTLAALRARCAEVLRGALPASPVLDAVPGPELTGTLLDSLRFRAFADAAPALEGLRRRGLRLVVVSNWDVSLPEVLGRVGLAPLLDGVVTSALVGESKPSPAPFERALQLAGAGPGHALHVGDSLREDIVGARAAGLEAVLLDRSGAAVPGVRTIGSLRELPELIAAWP